MMAAASPSARMCPLAHDRDALTERRQKSNIVLDHHHRNAKLAIDREQELAQPLRFLTDTPETGSSSRMIRGRDTMARAISSRR